MIWHLDFSGFGDKNLLYYICRGSRLSALISHQIMSGHSKWSTIKRQKGLADAKRAKVFTKLIKSITVAARGGADLTSNSRLRTAVEAARAANMSKDTIDRAIDRGSGATGDVTLDEVVYEIYGPGGAALVVEAVTDNHNRTATAIKQILNKHNARLAGSNSVRWQFESKGVVQLPLPSESVRESLELELIEAGAEDIKDSDGQMIIYTAPASLELVKKLLTAKNLTPDYAAVELVASNPITVDEAASKSLNNLVEDLDLSDDVNSVYTNEA